MKSAKEIFETELQRRGVEFTRGLEPNLYEVETDAGKLSVSLENIDRNYQRDRDPGSVVRFVDRVLESYTWPSWQEAKSRVFWAAEAASTERGDTISEVVSDTLVRLLVLADLDEGKLSWITPDVVSEWGIDECEVATKAMANLDALLEGIEPEVAEIDGMKLAMVPVDSAFKASVIFAPSWKRFIETVGWPVLVTIPCRDFLCALPESDRALLNRMGTVVQREYRQSGYPLTTEVLRISDEGIEAIGKFPE